MARSSEATGRSASVLDQEIAEQPEALERFLAAELSTVDRFRALLADPGIRYVLIAARGSSDNAARYAQYLFGARLGLAVALAAPSVISLYDRPPRLDGALVIGISQSGRSPDVVAVLEAARKQRRPSIAITNNPDSPLAATATEVLLLHAGEERSVAATKTYSSSLAALAVLCVCGLDGWDARRSWNELRRLPTVMAEVLAQAWRDRAVAHRYRDIEHCAVIGRGLNYSTAFEIALKTKELAGVLAEPYSPADLLHGPIATIGEGFPTILVAPSDASLPSLREIAGVIGARGANVIAITSDEQLKGSAESVLRLPVEPADWLVPLVSVLPGQVFAAELARARELDPDRPEGLTKVTETY